MIVFRPDQVLPLILTVIMGAAAVVSACCGRWLDALYWVGAVLLNVSILLRG